jgi:hypothetical protein
MRISCAVPVLVSVVTAAVLLALVPADAAVIYTGSGTHDYPPLTTAAGEDVIAKDTTTVNVLTGGSIGGGLWARENSTATVSGGSIGSYLIAHEDSTVTFSGGSIGDYLVAFENSTVTISGGTIGDYLTAVDHGTVTIIGSGFNFPYGDYFDSFIPGSLDEQILTGFLADGTAINNQVYIYASGTITLAAPVAAVPEPATAALALLGAGGLMCRRRAA